MKKILPIVLAVLLCAALMLPASAATYQIPETDFSIELDPEYFYIFTRGNLTNNPEMEELGLTEEAMSDLMKKESMYLDAFTYWDEVGNYIELLVIKSESGSIKQLSDCTDTQVEELLKKALKGKDTLYSGVVNTGKYKFIQAIYQDGAIYLNEYLTIVNGMTYLFKFQSSVNVDEEVEALEYEILESVRFDVDETIKNEKPVSAGRRVLISTLVGAAVGGITGGVIALIKKKRTKA